MFRAKIPIKWDFNIEYYYKLINNNNIIFENDNNNLICKSKDIKLLEDSCKIIINHNAFLQKTNSETNNPPLSKKVDDNSFLQKKEDNNITNTKYSDIIKNKKEDINKNIMKENKDINKNSFLEKNLQKKEDINKNIMKENKDINKNSLLEKREEKSKKEKMIKESMKIHPEILKMGFIYQMIGSKACNIKEMNNKVGNDCYIRCNEEEGVYEISCRSKRGINMARDLIGNKEREILTSPKNIETLSKCRDGFIYYRYDKEGILYLYKEGRKFIDMKGRKYDNGYGELVSRRKSIIEYMKRLDNIRYEMSKEESKKVEEIDENIVKNRYNELYNKKEEKKDRMNIEEIIEEFKSMPASPISDNKHWNKEKIEDIKKVLPSIIKSIKREVKDVEVDESIYMECYDIDISELLEPSKVDLSIDDMIDDEDLEDIEIEDYMMEDTSIVDAWD
jgi:hypothetical protein